MVVRIIGDHQHGHLVDQVALYLPKAPKLSLTPLLDPVSEADAFGLNAARQPDGFAQAAVQLSEYRKMHPGPVEEYLFYDHLSGWQRIHRAMVWKAENPNDPTVRSGDAIAPPGAR